MPPLISPPLRPHGVPGECEPGWMAAGGAAGGRGQPAPGRRASPGRGEPDPRGRGGRATKGSFANCLHVWRSLLLPPERVPDPHIRPHGMRDAGSGVRDGGCGMRHIGCERWDVGCGPVLTPRRCRPRVPRHRAREPEGKEGRKDVKSPKISRSRTGRGGEGGGAAPQGTISFPTANGKEEKPQPNTRHADGTPAPPHHPPPLRPPPALRPQPPARCPPRSPRHPSPLRSPLHSARWCVPQLQEIPDALHHAGCIPRPAKAPLQRTDMCWTSRAHDGAGISPLPAAAGDLLSARRSFSPFLFSTPAK